MWYFIKLIFFTFCITVATACYLLFNTTAGLRYDIAYLSRLLPGKLTVSKIDGTAFSGVKLDNIHFQTAEMEVSVKTLTVAWFPILLLKKKIAVETLSIENANVILSDKSTGSKNPAEISKLLRHLILNHIILKNIEIKQAKSYIKLNGELTDHWNIAWQLSQLDLKNINSNYQGKLNSHGSIAGNRMEPTLNTTFEVSHLKIQQQSINNLKGIIDINFKKGHSASKITLIAKDVSLPNRFYKTIIIDTKGNIALNQHNLVIDFKTAFNQKPLLSGVIQLPQYIGFRNPDQAVLGHIQLTEILIEESYLPYIKNFQGRLTAELAIAGTLKAPMFSGQFYLKKADFLIPPLQLHPTLSIQGELNHQLISLHGKLQSGHGKATLLGTLNLKEKGFPLSVDIKGDTLAAALLPEYQIILNPELKLTINYPEIKLTGIIHILEAQIKPKNFDTTTTLPEEVIIVQQSKTDDTSDVLLSLDLRLILDNPITLHYDNLDAKLAGKIHLTKNGDGPINAQGELYTTEGQYLAYQQKLIIDRGRLIYTGNNIMNPGLDIKAMKHVKRITTQNYNDFSNNVSSIPVYAESETMEVGLKIHGNLNKPLVALFSTASDLSQGDILSYLILGYPQSKANGNQSAALLSILTNLNPKNTKINQLTNKLQNTLGLSELSISSIQYFNPNSRTVVSNTSVVIGKQFTKKLSMHYSIGLFDPVSVLNLRYQLSPHWTLQSETSTVDNGADLLYVFERG